MSDKKCAHTPCKCIPAHGEKYCSPACENAKDLTTLECECNHPACASSKL
jgi:hypothetical protein